MRENENKDSGFTLVELIVAIVILALVAAPVLHAFLSSAQMNGNSKKLLRATTAAQNVMERIKGTGLEELLAVSSEAVVADRGDGSYQLTFGREMVSGQQYKVVAVLDPSEYQAASGEALNYNDMLQPTIYAIDSQYDGTYMPAVGVAGQISKEFAGANAFSDMTKTITLNIEKSMGIGSARITIAYAYNGQTRYEVKDSYIYRDATGNDAMRGMYIFFEPMYTAVSRSAKERIVINNPNLVPVTVYLIKQNTTQTNNSNEMNYAVDIQINEPGRIKDWSTESDYVPVTRINTNLTADQAKLSYSGAGGAMEAEKMVALCDLAGNVVENRIYKVEVTVYDEKGEELVTIDGTKER